MLRGRRDCLWDTTGNEVVKALSAERRNAGGVASGLALTLVAVVDEKRVREAETAAATAAAAHPCRLLIVVRSNTAPTGAKSPESRLDAEIVVGGRLGPVRGGRHAHARPARPARRVGRHPAARPGRAGGDVVARRAAGAHRERPAGRGGRAPHHRRRPEPRPDRRAAAAGRRLRPRRHRPRLDPDHAVALAARRRAGHGDRRRWSAATVTAAADDPTAALLRGWLQTRLGVTPTRRGRAVTRSRRSRLRLANGEEISVVRGDGVATLSPHRAARPGRCRWSAASSATSSPRSCAGSTPTSPTPAALAAAPAGPGCHDRPALPGAHLARPAPADDAASRSRRPPRACRPRRGRDERDGGAGARRTPEVLAQAAAARLLVRLVDAQAARGSACVVLTGGRVGGRRSTGRCATARPATRWTGPGWTSGGATSGSCPPATRTATRPRPARRCSTRCRSTRQRVHPMPASDGPDGDDPEAAAARYADALAEAARPGTARAAALRPAAARRRRGRPRGLDLPGAPGRVRDTGPWSAVRGSPKPPPVRITLTLPRDQHGRGGVADRRRTGEGRRGRHGADRRRAGAAARGRRARRRAHAVAARPGRGRRGLTRRAQPPLTALAPSIKGQLR